MSERDLQPGADDDAAVADEDDVEGHMINIGFDTKPLPVPGGPPIRGPKAPDGPSLPTGPADGPSNPKPPAPGPNSPQFPV